MTCGCPLCASPNLVPFLERGSVPVHQNLLFFSREDARRAPRGDLRLSVCSDCGFVTNTAFEPASLEYNAAYDNDQSCSGCFEDYVDGLIDRLVASGIRGKTVVEIGCGKGYFLHRLCERGGNAGVGVDPTYVGPEATADGRVRFVREFYGSARVGIKPDLIVCRHVIEHVPDPANLLRDVRRNLDGRKDVAVCFETPETSWILSNAVVQDFFYEHCSYFTADTLAFAFRAAGYEHIRVSHVFEGQYLWLESRPGGAAGEAGAPRPEIGPLRVLLDSYRAREGEILAGWRQTLGALRAKGLVAVWGAGAKGVTFLNLLDSDAALVDCVVDVNPRKQGRFLPGTGHPIVAPKALVDRRIRDVLLMNPNYRAEIQAMIERLDVEIHLHTEGAS